MGIREQLNRSPKLVAAVASVVVVLCGVLIALWLRGESPADRTQLKSFFSDDDGKTWFIDSAMQVPPFDHNGKQAVGARLFKCGDETFVGYLERFTAEGVRLRKQSNDPTAHPTAEDSARLMAGAGREVKKPLSTDRWLDCQRDVAEAKKVFFVVCPSGGGDAPEIVQP